MRQCRRFICERSIRCRPLNEIWVNSSRKVNAILSTLLQEHLQFVHHVIAMTSKNRLNRLVGNPLQIRVEEKKVPTSGHKGKHSIRNYRDLPHSNQPETSNLIQQCLHITWLQSRHANDNATEVNL